MNFHYLSFPFTCPASHFQSATVTLTAGNIVSVGIQNIGYRYDLYPTQFFPYQPNVAVAQVNNTSSSPAEWRIWLVVATSSAEEVPELGEVQHETSEIEPAN